MSARPVWIPKFNYNPNQKVEALYAGVAPNGRTVLSVIKPSEDRQRMETTRVYGPGLARGQGGTIGVFVIGGMETTIDECMEILAARKEKKFVARRTSGQIAAMCHELQERRNERIRYLRKNPSEAPKKRKVRLYLPVGVRMVKTSIPGLRVAVPA